MMAPVIRYLLSCGLGKAIYIANLMLCRLYTGSISQIQQLVDTVDILYLSSELDKAQMHPLDQPSFGAHR